ncbi:chemotaxis-specific protein-glutamate methyltransferase CheB [Erythrobacter cryptus]|uniref:chemotaxis-specific protein-glutamate methyltransferase CheB n=1 Tax=Erythrobacter cryptus TaxID=196588 RepID=UPI001FE0857A|nr:chemotaxis-specific protein-glutamate methyltransferase CheB [Erythrobacter cryptus]
MSRPLPRPGAPAGASVPPRPRRPLGHGAGAPIRVMIVDDSLTVRTILKRMVESDPALVIAGTASSAEGALAQLASTPADVVLLDLEMPGRGGLDALPAILATPGRPQVLVVSSLTMDGAEHTLAALEMGAADTLLKPRPGGFTEDYRGQLLRKIRALGAPRGDEAALAGGDPAAPAPGPDAGAIPAHFPRPARARPGWRPQVLGIGASTGGIHALAQLLRRMGAACDVPILITQHLPASFMPVFARQVETACGRPAEIARDGLAITAGRIVIAPGHGHLMVRRQGERLIARIGTEPAPSGCVPSVDPMLESLAQACAGAALAVILSGMGRDGAIGAEALVAAGGAVFAQDADSSAVWGMPGAVARAGLATLVASPERLGEAVLAQLAAPLPAASPDAPRRGQG